MWFKTISSQILTQLAEARRRVVADWRLLILARRICLNAHAPLPGKDKIPRLTLEMERLGYIDNAPNIKGVYIVVAPFASVLPVVDEQLVQEANPWAVFSHATAIAHHGLTNDIPRHLGASIFASPRRNRIPLDTTPDDWMDVDLPRGSRPKQAGSVKVQWIRMKDEFDFGHCVSSSQGIPIYVTDIERTLLDGLRAPSKSGGIGSVLRAWRNAIRRIDLDRLIGYTNRFENIVLRQRVGFLLELAGLKHSALNEWRKSLLRGGTVRLVAQAPYASTYSERWNLSLNAPSGMLDELKDLQ